MKEHAAASSILAQDIVNDAYESVKPLICSLAKRRWLQLGGSWEEWLSEANYLFVEAYHSYDGSTLLSSWVYNRIHWGLLTLIKRRMRNPIREISIMDCVGEHNMYIPDTRQPSFFTQIEHLSERAQNLWWLILEPPTELQGDIDAETPVETLDALQRYCRCVLKWTASELEITLKELKEVCTE